MSSRDPEERDLWRRSLRPLDKRSKRELVFERDGYKCLRCGARDKLTLDHVIPKVKGGSANVGNLQTLCRKCNTEKGSGSTDYRLPVPLTGHLKVTRTDRA